MAQGIALVRLNEDVEATALEMVLAGAKLAEIAKVMGLKSAQALQRYLLKFPEFLDQFDRARVAECILIEEEYRNIVNDYNPEYGKIQSEVLRRILAWRDPKRYGERQQIDMSVSIDISGSLERAAKRLVDVTPQNVVPLIQKKTQD